MIFSLILSPIIFILNGIFSLFPVVTVPSGIAIALSYATGSLYSLNSFIPITTFATVVGLYIGLEILIMFYKFLNWAIGKIPFINGSSTS